MIIDIKVPSPGESITEVVIANWLVADGDVVEIDQELAEIESDKATLPLLAASAGRVKLLFGVGETVSVGAVVCTVDNSVTPVSKHIPAPQVENVVVTGETTLGISKSEIEEKLPEKVVKTDNTEGIRISPLAKARIKEYGLSLKEILSGLKRLTVDDVEEAVTGLRFSEEKAQGEIEVPQRVKMSQLRKKIATRLVAVKNETAMLTTFNEVDMSASMSLRKKFQDEFQKKYGIKLGFMSLFTKAVCEALALFPNVNSMIEGDEILHFPSCDIGIAVQTPKGLMVPVIRNAGLLSLAEIEISLADLASKARNNKISLSELSGGTFTITNGGVFGSLLSTPILNPPQSGILGMHNILDRPVAVAGKVEIRPMMYIALSYDHRIIDGKDSVGFLVKVKEMIENPLRMLNGGLEPERKLLGL